MRTLLFIIITFFLSGCARPVYETYEVIPEESKSCVADAKQLMILCKDRKLADYENCQTRQEMIYQQALSTYQSNRSSLNSQLQTCITGCVQRTHPYEEKDGTVIDKPNTRSDCTGRYSTKQYDFGGSEGECFHLQEELDNMQEPSKGDCGHIYSSCKEEYKLNYSRCGASHKTVCVKNCDK